MPADYSSAAAALALSPSPGPRIPNPEVSTSSSSEDDDDNTARRPPWATRASDRTRGSTSTRRLSRPYTLHQRSESQIPLTTRVLTTATSLFNRFLTFYLRLPPLQQAALAAIGVISLVLLILALVYSHRAWAALGPIAKGWRELRAGWLIIWFLVFITAFPPMIGYSSACTVAGFVYGFPLGWPIIATASVAGSSVAFFTSRGIFSGYVDALVGKDKRFQALGHVMRHDGLWVLVGMRFAPLPYSLSNGFLATIPSISLPAFALSTALASPKLLVHTFIGSRLALLAEEADSMSARDKVINYLSMFLSGMVGLAVGIIVYRRTMARAAELSREEGDAEEGGAGGTTSAAAAAARLGGVNAGANDYADREDDALLDISHRQDGAGRDADAAALMDADDISLWSADGFDSNADGYRDEELGGSSSDDAGSKKKKGDKGSGSYTDA